MNHQIFVIQSSSIEFDGLVDTRLSTALASVGYRVIPHVVNGRYRLFAEIQRLTQLMEKVGLYSGRPVFLHILAHGSPDGIKVGEDVVLWRDLRRHLVPLNKACRNKLVICLASCEGIFGIRMSFTADLPFWKLVGQIGPLGRDEAASRFTHFYSLLAAGFTIEDAAKATGFGVLSANEFRDAVVEDLAA